MLIKTTYMGETVRRCDGCGHEHLGTGAEVYWVTEGRAIGDRVRHETVAVVASCCLVEFSRLYTRMRAELADRWSRGALALGSDWLLDGLTD